MPTKNNNIKKMEDGRLIEIQKLPMCDHKERLSKIVEDGYNSTGYIVILAIMCKDQIHWECFAGYPDEIYLTDEARNNPHVDWLWQCRNIRTHDEVKMLGNKLPEEVARFLFPDWAEKIYHND